MKRDSVNGCDFLKFPNFWYGQSVLLLGLVAKSCCIAIDLNYASISEHVLRFAKL